MKSLRFRPYLSYLLNQKMRSVPPLPRGRKTFALHSNKSVGDRQLLQRQAQTWGWGCSCCLSPAVSAHPAIPPLQPRLPSLHHFSPSLTLCCTTPYLCSMPAGSVLTASYNTEHMLQPGTVATVPALHQCHRAELEPCSAPQAEARTKPAGAEQRGRGGAAQWELSWGAGSRGQASCLTACPTGPLITSLPPLPAVWGRGKEAGTGTEMTNLR